MTFAAPSRRSSPKPFSIVADQSGKWSNHNEDDEFGLPSPPHAYVAYMHIYLLANAALLPLFDGVTRQTEAKDFPAFHAVLGRGLFSCD